MWEQNAVGSPLVYSLCQSPTLCHGCQGLLWSSWAVWSVLGWGVLVPMSNFPECTQFPWNPQPPTPRIVVWGALSRLAHCRLFPPSEPLSPSHTIHLHLLSELSYFLCCLSSWVHDKRVRQGKIKKKKRRENLSVSVGTKDQLTSLPFISNTWAFAPVPPIVPAKQLAVGVLVSMHFSLNWVCSLITPGQSCSERLTMQVVSDRARVKTQAVWFQNSCPKLTHLQAQSLQRSSTCDPMGLAAHQAPLSCSSDNFTAIIHWMNRWMKKEGRKEDSCKEGRMERHKEKYEVGRGWYSLEAFLKFILKQFSNFYWFLKFLAMPCGMWDHSFLTGDRTLPPCIGSTES